MGPRQRGKPGRSARDSAEPDRLEVGEPERSECDMTHWVLHTGTKVVEAEIIAKAQTTRS